MTLRKKPRDIEKIVKGIANHKRIQILELLDDKPGLALMEITDAFKMNFKTTSEHVRRMKESGLVMKTSDGNIVHHTLSPRGKSILKFLRILE